MGKVVRIPWGGVAAGYLGTARISNEDDARFIAGLNLPLTSTLTASVQYDGHYSNIGVTARIATIGGAPLRAGIVGAKGRFGPLVAVRAPLSC